MLESILEGELSEIMDVKNHAIHYLKNVPADKILPLAMAFEDEMQQLKY